MEDEIWIAAARIFYDLRRRGLAVSGAQDCLIAHQALTHDLVLLHDDDDFE